MKQSFGRRYLGSIIVFLVLVVIAGLLLWAANGVPAPEVKERIAIDASEDSFIYNGADLTWYSNNHVTSKASIAGDSGNASFAGTLGVTGNATFSSKIIYAMTNITPTTGSTLTASVAFYKVHSAGNITMTLGTSGATAGQLLILYGDDAYTVTINDTNIRTTTGSAIALGQYDVMVWIYSGAAWIEELLAVDS